MHKIVYKFCRVTSDQRVEVYDTYVYFTFGLVPFLKCFIMDMQICQNPNYANSETFERRSPNCTKVNGSFMSEKQTKLFS